MRITLHVQEDTLSSARFRVVEALVALDVRTKAHYLIGASNAIRGPRQLGAELNTER